MDRVTLTTGASDAPAIESAEQALALDEALTQLEHTDARAARVVELRYFAGLSPIRSPNFYAWHDARWIGIGATPLRFCTRHCSDVLEQHSSALFQ